MSFQALLADLEALSGSNKEAEADMAKAMANDGDGDEGGEGGDADDAKIDAAAADGEAAGEAEDGADAGAAADAGDGDDEGEQLGKSMRVIGEDGEEQEAIDATDLIKSLVTRLENNETEVGKAVGMLTDLVKSQATQLGALRKEVSTLRSAGRGRRTVVSVAEKPGAGDLSKSMGAEEPKGIPANEFMAKALAAQGAGKITGTEVARCEAYLNRGLDVPAGIKAKVLG